MMDEFDLERYQLGYADAMSLMDTYGAHRLRSWELREDAHPDYKLGFRTAVGVTLERQLQG